MNLLYYENRNIFNIETKAKRNDREKLGIYKIRPIPAVLAAIAQVFTSPSVETVNIKWKKTRIADLHYDILKHILIFVAKSSDGPASFARVKSVSKLFKELSMDKDILRAVEFSNTMLFEINGSFWLNNGLLFQCSRARNLSACKILLQHVEDLLDSANIKLGASSFASTELEEWIAIVDRQACTRVMSRHITLTMDVVKMLLGTVEKDIQNANELTLALNSGVKSC